MGVMKLRELGRRSGVARTTIKWYLREGLLPRGSATARNQADYSENHVSRIRFVRSMMELVGLSLAQIAITDQMREQSASLIGKLGWVWIGDHSAEDALGAVLGISAEQSRDAQGAFPEFEESASREAKWLLYTAAVRELVVEESDGFENLGSDREAAVQRVIIGNRLAELALLSFHRLAQRERWIALGMRAAADGTRQP